MKSDRDAFCERLGAVPQLPLNDFLRHFAPKQKLTAKELEQVMTKIRQKSRTHEHLGEEDANMKQRGSQKPGTRRASPETGNGGFTSWTDYVRLPPHLHEVEEGTYGGLVAIHRQIVQCRSEVNDKLKQTLALQSCETFETKSEEEKWSLPGGVHQPIAEQDSIFNWHNVVVVEEYEHTSYRRCNSSISRSGPSHQTMNKIIANSKKVLWSMHQTLRSDLRRRFTFGITFADTEVRLWHLNRAVAVVSEPFDLYTDAQTLVDVYSRLALATLEELGYDPNIELLRNLPSSCPNRAHSDQYRITICGEAYITVEVLADHATERGLGKCTRVYRAYKESDASIDAKVRTYYVIKDCWVEAGKSTEYEIYEDIMKRIEEHDWEGFHDAAPTNITDLLQFEVISESTKSADPLYGLSVDERKKFFVRVIAGEKVEVGGVVDDTHAVIGRCCSFPPENRKVYAVCERAILRVGEEPVLCGVATYRHGIEIDLPVQQEGCFLREIPALQHHRIVMEEGQRLLDNPEIRTVFSTMKDASYALFLLHSVGLVYGDVSSGNILRRPNGHGVLTDFESVRSVTDPTLSTMRTGTPDFCALEVVLGDFLAGKPLRNNAKRAFRDPDDPKEKPAPPLQAPAEGDNRLAWKFRDAHDLESIFWLILWLLLRHDLEGPVSPTYDADRKYDQYYTKIFSHTFYNSPARSRALADPDFLEQTLGTLPPEWNKYMVGALAILREELWDVYRARDKPLPPTLWAMVHLTCAMGERIPGSFVPPALEEGTSRSDNKREEGAVSVNAKAAGAASGICGSARKVGDKREREDAEEVVEESGCLTEPQLKRRKSTMVPSQQWSLRS
ncbi:uncharacterized protein SCHCODRAFT_02534112 [Schizophyllum commune H4-8]|nr:uncharacterized protein SCHCODRAFT_02534112 [Schizophyllum commune H4-8]KAI5897147.1 hypothetical protein SCHCODRAFT_02534112 [Schizophyllum commune H4-8]